MLIFNPGTQTNPSATLENAEAIAAEICKDLGLTEKPIRILNGDAEGWFRFDFVTQGHRVEVDIPGDDPETVCAGKPFVSRRLYVEGNSWLYGYALNSLARKLGLEE